MEILAMVFSENWTVPKAVLVAVSMNCTLSARVPDPGGVTVTVAVRVACVNAGATLKTVVVAARLTVTAIYADLTAYQLLSPL
jgi:hypothetical protein